MRITLAWVTNASFSGSSALPLTIALQEEAPISPIKSKKQHEALLALLDSLHNVVGERRSHPLAGLVYVVATLIEDYESETFCVPDAKPRDVLRLLMDQHGLKQSDLRKEIGSQGVVSEILRGKREINVRQAKALAKRFRVLPMAFI